ncbi:hypothetical protein GLOIN_2v1597489 [Rhizophagus clarus]|uniref:Ricin B lectin domain-containing protein n=1 Tax=Rhizophagus clarus TaxID=94130 RepID=A0A8H3LKT1_9GLOM|nr:hypothetical protein GLOIN_2v1597489 [Rhizophagus clarus]
MKFLNLLLLLLTILAAAAQAKIVLPAYTIRLNGTNLCWALDGNNIVLDTTGSNWALLNDQILPYGSAYKAVQYNGPNNQLTLAWNIISTVYRRWKIEKTIFEDDTVFISSEKDLLQLATAKIMLGGKWQVIAKSLLIGGIDRKQLWVIERDF